jgi:DNA-binding transcriptional MocR family regulator
VPIIEDDIYGELMLGDSRPRTVHSFDRSGNVILASSFSKALTGGYRIGWMVPGRRLEEARKYKMCLNYGTNPAAELGIACFLQDGGYDHHLRTLRRTLREKIYWLRNAIARHFPENTLISDPKGGFVLWVEMDPKVDTVCVYRKAVEQGISIAPGPMFSAHGQYANCMRLNAAFVGPEHEEKIEALGQIVKREIEKE